MPPRRQAGWGCCHPKLAAAHDRRQAMGKWAEPFPATSAAHHRGNRNVVKTSNITGTRAGLALRWMTKGNQNDEMK